MASSIRITPLAALLVACVLPQMLSIVRHRSNCQGSDLISRWI
jgi:hypothetical protein